MVKEMLEKGLSEEFILSFANINKRVLSQGIDTKLNEKARIEPGLIHRRVCQEKCVSNFLITC